MAHVTLSGGHLLQSRLSEIIASIGPRKYVSIGFMPGAEYPDHTPVAMVAAIQNFGAPEASIPARPFFTNMVKDHKGEWPEQIGQSLEHHNYDGIAALNEMGRLIKEELQESVIETLTPALSPITVMLRGMRSVGGEDFKVTGATVGEAAKRVRLGLTNYGASTKPLIDTPAAHLINSVDYVVE